MNYLDTMICWDLGGKVGTVAWPDNRGVSDAYQRTCGAAYFGGTKATFEQRKCRAFIDAMTLIVRDGCDPTEVHEAFLKIDEYADGLPDDMLTRELLSKRMEG